MNLTGPQVAVNSHEDPLQKTISANTKATTTSINTNEEEEEDDSGEEFYNKMKQRARKSALNRSRRGHSDGGVVTGKTKSSTPVGGAKHTSGPVGGGAKNRRAPNRRNSLPRRRSLDAAQAFGSAHVQQSLRNINSLLDDDDDDDDDNNKDKESKEQGNSNKSGEQQQQEANNKSGKQEAAAPIDLAKKSPVARRRSLDAVLMDGCNDTDLSAFGRNSRRQVILDVDDNSSISSTADIDDLRNMCNTLDDALSKHSSSHFGEDGSWSSYDSDNPPPRNAIREVVIAALPDGAGIGGGDRAIRRSSYNSMDQMLLGVVDGGGGSHHSSLRHSLTSSRAGSSMDSNSKHGAPARPRRITSDDERSTNAKETEEEVFGKEEEEEDDTANNLEKHHLSSIRTHPDQPPKKVPMISA